MIEFIIDVVIVTFMYWFISTLIDCMRKYAYWIEDIECNIFIVTIFATIITIIKYI